MTSLTTPALSSRVSPIGSNLMLQRRVSFMEPRGSLHDGEQHLRKRRRQPETEPMDLQSARFMEHGISLGMSRTRKEREKSQEQEKTKERHAFINFVTTHFTCKECSYFSPKTTPQPGAKNPPQCHCGDFEGNHYKPPQQSIRGPSAVETNRNQRWNGVDHIMELTPTNAFGQIEFINEGLENRKYTEFIRMADTNKIEDVLELMKNYWDLLEPRDPSLCISVIGGAKNFKLEGRKKEVFHHGLIKAAQTTDAWLITSGLNLGIIRVVGDALQEGQTFHWGKKRLQQRLRCIGVAPWGYVLHNERLIRKDCQGSFPAQYKVTNVIKSGSPVSLNPNHTHYIFVDEGFRRRYGGCKSAEVRAELERKIAQPISEGGLQIPVVLVIVEGGYDVFMDAKNSIRQRVPVVICDGTGRAADILAFAAKKIKFGTMDTERNLRQLRDDHKHELMHRLTEKFGDTFKEREKDINSAIDYVQEIVSDEQLITVFDMNRSSDLDMNILYALLKKEGSSLAQLNLALKWSRVDIASEKIFKDDFSWSDHPQETMNELVEWALLEDKVEFVKLFLQHGLVMKEFLTVQRLRALYQAEPSECHFRKVMHTMVPGVSSSHNAPLYLSQVRYLLRKLVMKYHNPTYDEDNPKVSQESVEKRGEIDNRLFQHPFNELFLWAVLTKKQAMARYFWERTNEAIPQAIAASRIYYALAKSLPSHASEDRHNYHAWKDDFEQLAVKVVEECNSIDPEKAALLIEKKHQTWGGLNCLEMAAAAQDRKFLSTVVCQNSVNFIWNQGVHCSMPIIFLCVFLPPLVFFPRLVRFQMPKEEENNCVVACKKLLNFYHAPKTKFVLNAIATFVTIGFYAAFLLFGFDRNISVTEYVVIAIIFSYFIEECRELIASKSDTIFEKINDWWNFSSWNRMDVIMVLIGVVSACIRLATGATYYYTCKTLYVLMGAFVFLRVFRLYSVNPRLGPKLVMIKKMVVELLLYLAILAVALLTYGICSQSLLYPIRPFSWNAIKMIFYYPYWQIYGEIYLEAANAEEPAGCNGTNQYNTLTGELCPTFHWLVLVLLAVYLIIANVLLLNLLIAIFSNIFQEVQENSLEIWKFEMYFLVVEYERKPYLPFPLVVIEDIVRLVKFLICLCRCPKKDEEIYVEEEEALKNDVIRFSNDAVKTYINHLESEHSQLVSVRLDKIEKRMDEVYRLIEDDKHVHAHHIHAHGRQSSLEHTLGHPRPASAETRPQTAEGPKPEAAKNWPETGTLLETTPRKKMEQHPKMEAVAEAQVERVRDEKEREERARRFEEEMAAPAPPDDTSSCHSSHRNDLSGDLCRRLDEFENRTEAVLDSLRSAMFEQQKKEKTTGGASKKRVQGLETRLANLEENTGRSLANIESLLRRILTGREERKETAWEVEDEEDEDRRRKGGRRAFR